MRAGRENDRGYDHGYDETVRTVSKSKLKARMLEYFREVERTGEPLVVTDHGREVLEVWPVGRKSMTTEEVLAWYRSGPGEGCANIPTDEILAPVPVGEWEALRDDR